MTESDRLEEIFSASLKIRDEEQRRKYVLQSCGGNVELANQVFSLLSASQEAASFLESPVQTRDQVQGGDLPTKAYVPRSSNTDFQYLSPPIAADDLGALGPYRILNFVGRGGMGTVFRAFDPKLQRVVAIKVLAPEIAIDPTARKRFEREARSAAAVSHPHCVVIYAVEETHNPPYMVMEFIQGKTLADKIATHGALSVKEILRIGAQIADGLAAAHKQGLVHRDMKPANILLENGVERAKVADFGLAKSIDDGTMTRTGDFSGTPQYMSPEQASGGIVDHRTDLFSLGAILYTICTGKPPFRADNPLAVLKRICESSPRPIEGLNREIPEWLCDIVNRLLAKSPADRFQTAAEVADLLQKHLAMLQEGPYNPRRKLKLGFVFQRNPLKNRLTTTFIFGALTVMGVLAWLYTMQSQHDFSPLSARKENSRQPASGGTNQGTGGDRPGYPMPVEMARIPDVVETAELVIGQTDLFDGSEPGDRRELTELNIAFRWCPPGEFTMGSPKSEIDKGLDENQVKVTLTRGFWLQEIEVTQGQWQSLMQTTPWKVNKDVEEGADYPATYVNHNGDTSAAEYCKRLTAQERTAGRLPLKWVYRLPTEAEWEYACRAGSETMFAFGNDVSLLGDWAWWGGNDEAGNARNERYAHRVGLKKPNAWGLKDMHGNLWEWCEDLHVDTLPGGIDPVVAVLASGRTERSYRGGSWLDASTHCRSARRGWSSPRLRNFSIGFRPLASRLRPNTSGRVWSVN